MRRLKYFGEYLLEKRAQMDMFPEGPDPIKDKPLHVHIEDALEDMQVMDVKRFEREIDGDDINSYATDDEVLDKVFDLFAESEHAKSFFIEFLYRYDVDFDDHDVWNSKKVEEFKNDEPDFDDKSNADFVYIFVNWVIDNWALSDMLTKNGYETYKGYFKDFIEEFEGFDRMVYAMESEQLDNGLVKAWRKVTFKNKTDDYDDVYEVMTKQFRGHAGVYWSYEEDAAEAHWGDNFSNTYTFTALVRPQDINWAQTVWTSIYDLNEECEINVTEGAPIMITSYDTNDGGKEFDPGYVVKA